MKDFKKNDAGSYKKINQFAINDICVIVDNFVEIGDFSVFIPFFVKIQ